MSAAILAEPSTLQRVADVLDALPARLRNPIRRAQLFAALETAAEDSPHRLQAWDTIRTAGYIAGGILTPLYAAMPPEYHADPYEKGAPLPSFDAILSALQTIAATAEA